ncbi:uncharacterized protein LOC116203424 isoform X2 [Punica granatum]|uniref:Uncharacterized protein LOC116203424 isoform X2 n=1 Tax=Punica granatum TaxID=22663 RepID=A0A6P8D8Z8_PUNGR|nr:uncharacterized protein LOC116203424 isoform X2 [Punica granatum]
MMISMKEEGYGLKSSHKSLVDHLKKKLQNPKQEYPLIPEQDIYQFEPEDNVHKYDDICGITSGDEECYYFCPFRGRSGKVISRSTPEGFWHSTGKGRKAQETDQTKWSQRNLVYYHGSKQKRVSTDWAMQEYTVESDPSFSLCYIHKKRRNKRSNKTDSAVLQPNYLDNACRPPTGSENQNKPEEVTPEASVDKTMEHQTGTRLSDMNASGYSSPSPQEGALPAQQRLSFLADAVTDCTESRVLSDPQFHQMYMVEQSPYPNNASSDTDAQQHGSWQYPLYITAELYDNGSLNLLSPPQCQYPQHVFAQPFNYGPPNFQSPPQYHLQDVFARSFNDESSSLLYPLQHVPLYPPEYQNPQNVFTRSMNRTPPCIPSPPPYQLMMPMEEIFPSIDDGFSNSSVSISQMGYFGQASAEMRSLSIDHGPQEASVNTKMESQNLPLSSNINIPEYNMSSPQQTQITAEGRSPTAQDTYYDSLQLADLDNPQDPQILMREQSPCSENTFVGGCDQEYGNWSYHSDVTPEEGGNKFIFPQTPIDQSLNYVLPGCGSPPQLPHMMPTEEIYPFNGNASFNGRCSSNINSQLDIHGQGAELPMVSMNCGRQEKNFKEAQQSTLNLQTPTPSPNSDLLSPEDLQMLQELLSVPNMQPSPDSSGGGSSSALYFGQSCDSQHTDLEVTRGFAIESPPSTQYSDLDSMLANFFASSPPPEVVVGKSLCGQVSTVTGGYSTEYCGVPYASGGTYKTSNHMSAGC